MIVGNLRVDLKVEVTNFCPRKKTQRGISLSMKEMRSNLWILGREALIGERCRRVNQPSGYLMIWRKIAAFVKTTSICLGGNITAETVESKLKIGFMGV